MIMINRHNTPKLRILTILPIARLAINLIPGIIPDMSKSHKIAETNDTFILTHAKRDISLHSCYGRYYRISRNPRP